MHINSKTIVEEFERTWEYTRKMTTSFIECVPDDKWNFSHHPKFGPLSKQFRHMIEIYGLYIEAFSTRKLDFSKKNTFFKSQLIKSEILKSLSEMDNSLKSILANLKEKDLSEFKVQIFGSEMGFTEYTHVLIQHECSHFGIWTNYAAFGGFETPQMWQEEWNL